MPWLPWSCWQNNMRPARPYQVLLSLALSCPNLPWPIQSSPVLSCLALHYPTLSLPPLSGFADHTRLCQVLPSPVWHWPSLRGLVRSSVTVPGPVWRYPVFPAWRCPVRPCQTLPGSSRPSVNLPCPALLCYRPPSLALHRLILSFSPLSRSSEHARFCQILPTPVRQWPTLHGITRACPVLFDRHVWPCPAHTCLTLALSNTPLPAAVRFCWPCQVPPGLALPCPALTDIRDPARSFPTMLVLSGATMLHHALHEHPRSCPTLPRPTQPGPALHCLALSYPAWSCIALVTLLFSPLSDSAGHARSCQVLPSPVRHWATLHGPARSFLALPGAVWSCPILPDLCQLFYLLFIFCAMHCVNPNCTVWAAERELKTMVLASYRTR